MVVRLINTSMISTQLRRGCLMRTVVTFIGMGWLVMLGVLVTLIAMLMIVVSFSLSILGLALVRISSSIMTR